MIQSWPKLVLLFVGMLCISWTLMEPSNNVLVLSKEMSGNVEIPTAVDVHAASGPSLSNLLRPTESVYSGGEPVGAKSFEAIASLGVQVVVSVDGVRPQIDEAASHDLQYVHIPIGYDGVDESARLSLVRLAQECNAPIYVHCHHGRHRGPAAAAILGRALGELGQAEAVAFFKQAGTDPVYRGLYRDVRNFETPDDSVALPKLVSQAEVATLAEQMARIDRHFDQLQSGTRSTADSILLLQEFKEATRGLEPSGMREMMKAAEILSRRLHEGVSRGEDDAAKKAMNELTQSCVRCHESFRTNDSKGFSSRFESPRSQPPR